MRWFIASIVIGIIAIILAPYAMWLGKKIKAFVIGLVSKPDNQDK